MANNTDLIVSKLSTKFADGLSKPGPATFGDLWRRWSTDEGSSEYLTGAALLAEYGGTGTFDAREAAYWTAYNAGSGGWGLFTEAQVSGIDNTVTLSKNDDYWSATGVGGNGTNDRRIYYLNGSNVTDCEVRLTMRNIGVAAGAGQVGIALRGAAPGPAVVVWQNILFAATGNVLNGIWQYNGTTLQSTNQMANTNDLWGPDIVNGFGTGSIITVNTRGAHYLRPGHLINFTGFGGATSATVLDTPTADQFRFYSTTSGSWTGGNYAWVIAGGPRELAVRLVGSTLTTKQWPVGSPEPSWADPIRAEVNTIPGTLAVGGVAAPASGMVGIVVAHIGNLGQVLAKNLRITNL